MPSGDDPDKLSCYMVSLPQDPISRRSELTVNSEKTDGV
jgi:hypothetical protein